MYKNNNKTRHVINLIWQLMTFGQFYDAVKEVHSDPKDEKYDRLGPHFSEHIIKTISDEARDDLKVQRNGKLENKKPKMPKTLIDEATEQIKLLDAKVRGGEGFRSPPPGQAMESYAPSDASFDAMDENARRVAGIQAEKLRQRIENSHHPQLDPLDGLTEEEAEDLAPRKGDHIKLSVQDTPKWVAKHLFGNAYNEKRDSELRKITKLFNS